MIAKNEDQQLFFTRLFLSKINVALPVLLDTLEKAVKKYEELAAILLGQQSFQNSSLALSEKSIYERQLTYLVKICNQILP